MAVENDEYCRAIESYLCRKNDGHLIRIVGPAFERVCAWAEQGVPLKAAYRGIDRYFERYYAKGQQRRRPVRVEFCEPDVMDVFDEWRRAVRVSVVRETTDTYGTTAGEAEHHRAHVSLKNHLERTLGRLRGAQAEGTLAPIVADAIRLVEGLAVVPPARGEARRRILEELRACDEHLIAAANAQCEGPAREELVAEAEEELAPFRARMPAEAYEQSRQACVTRLIRERLRLPVLTYE